jgi:hypothetical protein
MLGQQLYQEFKTFYSSRNRQDIPVPDAVDLGLPEVLYFEGAWVTHGYECESTEFYLICPDMVELFSPQSMLMEPEGPTWNMQVQAHLYIVSMFGNMRWHPKFHGHGSNIADS